MLSSNRSPNLNRRLIYICQLFSLYIYISEQFFYWNCLRLLN